MKFKFLVLIALIVISCKKKKSESEAAHTSAIETSSNNKVLDLEIYDFKGFKKFLNISDDKTYVINFWATWCGPCVKELPYFEKLHSEYGNHNVEVILVSLDFPHMYESKLKPFIVKRDLKSKVIALNDSNENEWISEVDASWSGSIPATIIYNKNKRKFFEKSFTYKELENEVKQLK